MMSRRCRMITLNMVHTKSRSIALITTAIISIVIWFEFLSQQEKPVVRFEFTNRKSDIPVFQFRPLMKSEADQKKTEDTCPILSIKSVSDTSFKESAPVSCKRAPPLPGSCDIAKELFMTTPVSTCSQEPLEFCQLERLQSGQWGVSCDPTTAQICHSVLSLGTFNGTRGSLQWQEGLTVKHVAQKLTEMVQTLERHNYSPHFGFVFIKCGQQGTNFLPSEKEEDYYEFGVNEFSEQLLILPPPPLSPDWVRISDTSFNFHNLSINLILIDSVSHQHFFRSLPKSVSVLNTMASNLSSVVINFELFQAIKSRTFETLQAIFSGSVNITEKPFRSLDISPKPLNLAPIFKTLQGRGFRTLWLEDLCYLWEWGISKDLHFLNLSSSPYETWKRMQSVLKKNGVESVDVTLSMCRILEANQVRDHFHGPETVCFNGKHQHEYLLDYLRLYQERLVEMKQPFLTMTSTNVGHEETGKRIQTLDEALAHYLEFTSSLHNTISIVFSDHGNAYGDFFKQSKEAQIELFRPFMFFIIPESTASVLGQDYIENLKQNSKRLVSALDLHHTLEHITNSNTDSYSQIPPGKHFNVSKSGLFSPVDPARDCNSVPRIRPNVCICQGFKAPLATTSYASLFAYFALGIMNEEIQRQYGKSSGASSRRSAFGSCQPLELTRVSDLAESWGAEGQHLIQMNLHVQQSQVFMVSIATTHDQHREPSSVLETVTRLTQYSIFRNCSDTEVELSLCICDTTATVTQDSYGSRKLPGKQRQSSSFSSPVLAVLPSQELISSPIRKKPCLVIFSVKHKDGVAILVFSKCQDVSTPVIEVQSDAHHIYYQRQHATSLYPGGIAMVGLVINEKGDWNCSIVSTF